MNYNFYGTPQIPQLKMDKVANIEEAKRYQIIQGQTIYLLDSEKPVIYMKNSNGLFGYELKPIDITGSNFVTRDDLNSFKNEILEVLRNGESTIAK